MTADEEYLRESIVDPGAKIVKGYPNVMPTFKTTLSAGGRRRDRGVPQGH